MITEPQMPISLNIPDACAFTGLNRSALYRLVSEGRLCPRKIGRRTLFLAADLRALVEGAPAARIRRTAA